jgi:hypothetical protein
VLLNGGSARPYMAMRMPQFGDHVGSLAEGLAACDGVRPNSDAAEVQSTDELTTAGRTLIGADGLNCISCHVFSRAPIAGTPGPNITDFAERLRYEWWRTYVMDPTRMKPGTRMPLFFATGQGQNTKVFNGDAQKQIDAMWAYFSLGFAAPAPEGLPKPGSGGFALKPETRPIVMRTFLKDAGARGIAVGYPAPANGMATHFAFDATAVRLISAWTGDFLDAGGAWASRGGNISGGRGETVWEAEAGMPLRIVGKDEKPGVRWPKEQGAEAGAVFGGYVLEADGTPRFQYRIGAGVGTGDDALQVEERFVPATGPEFIARREWVIANHRGRTIELRTGRNEARAGAENAGIAASDVGDDKRFMIRPKSDASVKVVVDLLRRK